MKNLLLILLNVVDNKTSNTSTEPAGTNIIRGPDLTDIVILLIGVIAGIIITLLIVKVKKK